MKKRILCLILIIVTILSTMCINVSASTSLSEDSAKKFLRFITGSAYYTPKSDNEYYNFLIGKNNDEDIKETILFLVYKTIDENWYQRRLELVEKALEEEISKNVYDFALDVVDDEFGPPIVGDLENVRVVFESVAALFNMRNSDRANYFNTMIGIDPNDENFDLISNGSAVANNISPSDKQLLDEWVEYIRTIDNIKTNITNNIQSQSPNMGDSSNYSCRITFDSNCNDVSDYKYTYYSDQDNWHVPTMTRDEYIFCGWYLDSACRHSAAGTVILDSDKIFYAKWIKRFLKVTLDSNCSFVENKIITVDLLNKENTTIPNMTRDGYIFSGWYLDKDCTNEMPSTMTISTDLKLYAKWVPQFTFEKRNKDIIITGIANYIVKNGSLDGNISIPRSIDGCIVKGIDSRAFYSCDVLTSITIPDSVTVIGERAFYNCNNLISITIPGNTIIENYAFHYTAYYNNPLNWKNGVLYIGKCLIEAKETILGAYSIKEDTIHITEGAFSGCDGLTSITIPDGVTSIGDYVFEDCTSLTSIIIPDSVTSIGYYAFYGCESLTNITIPDGVTSIEMHAFDHCNSLTSITIPNSVTSIGDSSFYGCESLTSIELPNDVTSIGTCAFEGCTSLTSVTIPDGVTSIEYFAFEGCTSLTSITIPDSVTSIGDFAFGDCSSLTSITIPDSVTSIGNNVFWYCNSLKSITLPNRVTSFGDFLFEGCTSLTSITLPNGVTSIVDSAFAHCNSLTSITIPDGVTSIGNSAFAHCNSLTSITIPDGVTSIGDNVFWDCNSLTSITIPDSVTSIGDNVFWYCNGLTSITFPNSVTSFGDFSFEGCAGLTSITLPNGVTSIGNSAFAHCNSLTSITIPDGVTSIGDSAFSHCNSLTSITIPDGVTSIGNSAFAHCNSLTSITIPDGVTSIGDSAFNFCNCLTSITLPDSVTSIGESAFADCNEVQITHYYGTPQQWGNVTIESNNEALTDAIVFVKHTKTNISEDGKILTVNPVNVDEGKEVIVALYKGNVFVEMQSAIYKSEELEFETTKEYDTVKIMIWNTLSDLNPITQTELL